MINIILLKFLIIFVMAFLFGIERQLSNKPVGFGTFIFVAVGSCAISIVAENIMPENVLIIIGGILTGIGFLGAGALIKTTDKIAGFTTAASIWVFSILGISIGFGNYFVGTLTYLMIWIIIGVDKVFEIKGLGSYQRKVTIRTKKILKKEEVIKIFGECMWKLINFDVDKKKNKSVMIYLITAPRNYVDTLSQVLIKSRHVESFKIE